MENLLINEHERVDNLHLDGYKIIQNTQHFRYGVDAVLLSWFAGQRVFKNAKIIDLGTGTGIIPILLVANEKCIHVDAIEIQDYYADLASRNIKLNNLQNYINVTQGDIRNLSEVSINPKYDIVVSNPPYMKGSIHNEKLPHAIARHEITWSMEALMVTARKILKDRGKLIFIHRASRLVDIIYNMRANGIEPKVMRLVTPKLSKDPNLVLIEGHKNGKAQLTVEKPIVIYNENGDYTDELKDIYYNSKKPISL
ncbi:methyltransferase [Alkalibaculum sporogenes]|uniref:methyltransferase n=1 Tax=Alkalibaculum sporogenes TaxID=2655001 RepID=UPI00128AE813